MINFIIVIFFVLFSFPASSYAQNLPGWPKVGDVGSIAVRDGKTRFIIVTTKGYVSFEAVDSWTILALKSKPPVAVMVFQLHNAADQGTPDSTNLAISLLTVDSEQARKSIAIIGNKHEEYKVATNKYRDWIVYTQQNIQEKTLYTMYDAKKKVSDILVVVSIAWPHLPKNSVTYDKNMQAIFYSVLDSVKGEDEAYKAQGNEIFRRPTE